jgi:hypothetical protein
MLRDHEPPARTSHSSEFRHRHAGRGEVLEHALTERGIERFVIEIEPTDVTRTELNGKQRDAGLSSCFGSMMSLASTPTTDPIGPTLPARALATSPVPQPRRGSVVRSGRRADRTRRPGVVGSPG